MRGIDISRWNVVTDYNKVKKSGVEFAVLKVNNAGNVPDTRFYEHVEGCKSAGIPCNMGYNYSYANTVQKAMVAAQSFVDIGKGAGIDYMWMDLEDTCMRNLDQNIVNIINTYQNIAISNGMKFGVYTYVYFYNKYIKPYVSYLKDIPIWIACYPSTKDRTISEDLPTTKNIPSNIALSGWQYSSKGVIPGITGYVDLDMWYNNAEIKIGQNESSIITVDANPFTEPTTNCNVGTMGNDANWCLWFLWRFGYLLDSKGVPDETQINGLYTKDTFEKVKQIQEVLGFKGNDIDGIVGKKTRALFKKVAQI